MSETTGGRPLIVEAPLDVADFDAARARRDGNGYVYSDLLFFYGLGGSRLGTVSGRLVGGRIAVLTRARYAAIAQDLGYGTIECTLPPDTDPAMLADLLKRPGTRLVPVDWASVHDAPEAAMEWHVVAFERLPTDEELARFAAVVSSVFEDPGHPVTQVARAEGDPAIAYFQAWTSHGRADTIRFLSALARFDRESVPIRSYRGSRFEHPSA